MTASECCRDLFLAFDITFVTFRVNNVDGANCTPLLHQIPTRMRNTFGLFVLVFTAGNLTFQATAGTLGHYQLDASAVFAKVCIVAGHYLAVSTGLVDFHPLGTTFLAEY